MKLSPVIAACAALTLAAGCGSSVTGGAAAPPKAPASATPTATPTAPHLTPTEEVHQVALTRSDLPDGYSEDRQQAGDEVDGQVTLDLCGADFASEDLRIARHQVSFALGNGRDFVGNEVVEYAEGEARQALDELRAAARSCPSGYTSSHVRGMHDLKTVITEIAPRPGWQPGTYALKVRITERGGSSTDYLMVLQPHGDVVSMLYLSGAKAAALLDELADLLGARLDDVLPATLA